MMRGGSLHSRVGAAAVLATIFAAGALGYLTVRSTLLQQVDSALRSQERALVQGNVRSTEQRFATILARAGGPARYAEISQRDGQIVVRSGDLNIPLPTTLPAVGEVTLRDQRVSGRNLRILALVPRFSILADGVRIHAVVQLGRPLSGVASKLATARILLALACLLGTALVLWPLPRDRRAEV